MSPVYCWPNLHIAQQGPVIRADVHVDPIGRPKGSGIVVFESPDDARNAIQQFNGFDFQGRPLEVREDRYAAVPMGGRGGFGGMRPPFMGARGGFGGMRGGFGGMRGGFGFGGRGGFGGGFPGEAPPPNPFTDFATSGGERSDTIYARNVSVASFHHLKEYMDWRIKLPWSTCNDDLVELFSTIGKVERAEIQYEPNGRSRGTGVVQFDSAENAETAISQCFISLYNFPF